MVKVNIIIPFTYLDNYYYHRYYDQFKAYADNFENVTILVESGVENFENTIPNLSINFMQIRKSDYVMTLKQKIVYFIKKVTLINYVRRWSEIPIIVEYWRDKPFCYNADALISYSGTGWQQYMHCKLGESLGIPVIYRMRGNGVKEREQGSLPNRLASNYLHNKSLELYDYHIPISQEYYRLLLEWGISPRRISDPLTIGVNTMLFTRKWYPKKLTFGFIGNLTKIKNIDFLIEVMNANPDLNFMVVGKKIHKFKFPSNCKVYKAVPKDNVPYMFNYMNMLLHPSLSEGTSNVILESYSTNTPVLGTENAFGDLKVFGFSSEPDVHEWSIILNGISEESLSYLGMDAREYAATFEWKGFGKSMRKIVDGVIKDEYGMER